MTSRTMLQVGVVEELTRRGTSLEQDLQKWHFRCSCGQRLRFPHSVAIEFDCPHCGLPYSVSNLGQVFAETATTPLAWGDSPPPVIPRAQAAPEVARPHPAPANKGLFGRLTGAVVSAKDAAAEAHEAARGAWLKRGLAETHQNFSALPPDVVNRALEGFLVHREALLRESMNWSKEGCFKVARQLQRNAKEAFDFNQADSYAIWLAGAWLEAKHRTSDDAVFVYIALEELAKSV